MLNIGGLEQGVVIDHIPAGAGMKIYQYMGLEKMDCTVALIKNATSHLMGRKDIIKIEGPLRVNLDILGVIDPRITVNIIAHNEIIEKRHVELPETVTNVIQCTNPRCISSIEQELPQIFRLTDREHGIYRCIYCDQKVEFHNS